ncbi:hypothetical protein [Cohnella phaseoli]|uniref:Trehalase n=1 Tax=Cohnella phaseoli TaxID=456490 RepID=A0A3D9JMJ6_9BACL|nr:hypothetical protein [Cohnella phaseoli]RED75215.1 hypothetical protein DFP98_11617 [Cohnella phaseoli]
MANALFPGREAVWQRPFTAKRYLHPPLAECLVTMWPDCKVMIGDVVEDRNHRSAAFRLLFGEAAEEIPFEEIVYHSRPDGIPIHEVRYDGKNYALSMESFCSTDRVPTAYTRITVSNPHAVDISDTLCVMARSGKEELLTGMEWDGYCHFNPNVHNWGFIRSGWRYRDGVMEDGAYELRIQQDYADASWVEDGEGLKWSQRHLLKLRFKLPAGQSRTFSLAFRRGATERFQYEDEREKAVRYWEEKLSRIQPCPDYPSYFAEIERNFVSQLLQMFSYPVGKDYVLPRQGGLQRAIWPVEALEFLIALDRIGNFHEYTERAYDTFFEVLQVKTGADVGLVLNMNGEKWACNTAGAIWGASRHVLFRQDKAVFEKYRTYLLLGFDWIERQRSATKQGQYAGHGIFPPMKAHDWQGEYQSWCFTDAHNLIGIFWLAEVLAHYGDPRADEVRDAYEDYMACMRSILEQQLLTNVKGNEVLISNQAGQPPLDPPIGPIGDSAISLIRAGVIQPDSQAFERVENYYRNRGYGTKGLMGLMSDGLIEQGHNADYWAGHTWYTSGPDIPWFYAWLERGERDKAERLLQAQLTYSMTPEYYMCERYADNDPYFVPWLPNASANGRTIMMMRDFVQRS